jgi:hypothetical protein
MKGKSNCKRKKLLFKKRKNSFNGRKHPQIILPSLLSFNIGSFKPKN